MNEVFKDYWCKKCKKPSSYPMCCYCGSRCSVEKKENIIIIKADLNSCFSTQYKGDITDNIYSYGDDD